MGSRVYCWGEYILEGDRVVFDTPQLLSFFNEIGVVQIASSPRHAVALTDSSDVYCFGENDSGQCGSGDFVDVHSPRVVKSLSLSRAVHSYKFVQVVAGGAFSAALSSTGDVYFWGAVFAEGDPTTLPRILFKATDDKVVSISVGEQHMACVTSDGELLTVGLGRGGRLGNGTESSRVQLGAVARLHPEYDIILVECGGSHTLCVTSNGSVFAFGKGSEGQLGIGRAGLSGSLEPVEIHFEGLQDGERISSIAAGAFSSFFVTNMGRVFACGGGEHGQLGILEEHEDGTRVAVSNVIEPTLVASLDNIVVKAIVAAESHTLFLSEGNQLYICGRDSQRGILDVSDDDIQGSIPQIVRLFEDSNLLHISANSLFSLCVVGTHILPQEVTDVAVDAPDRRTSLGCGTFSCSKKTPKNNLDEETEAIWRKVVDSWPGSLRWQSTMEAWRRGLTDAARRSLWPILVGNDLHVTPALYNEMCIRSSRTLEEAVTIDLDRTMGVLHMFQKSGPFHESLKRILLAVAAFRPDVGYVQGMSFIGATILLHVDEYDAFCCTVNLLHRSLFFQLYTMQVPNLWKYIRIFDILLKENLPSVARRFEELDLTADTFLLSWFLTVYVRPLPFSIACRIWDSFLLEGESVLFKAAIGIISYFSDTLSRSSFDEAQLLLNRLERMEIDENNLLKCIQKVKVTSRRVVDLLAETSVEEAGGQS